MSLENLDLTEEERKILNEIKEDMEEILLKCFKGKEIFEQKNWITDCITTVTKYHSYKRGVIPYPEELEFNIEIDREGALKWKE